MPLYLFDAAFVSSNPIPTSAADDQFANCLKAGIIFLVKRRKFVVVVVVLVSSELVTLIYSLSPPPPIEFFLYLFRGSSGSSPVTSLCPTIGFIDVTLGCSDFRWSSFRFTPIIFHFHRAMRFILNESPRGPTERNGATCVWKECQWKEGAFGVVAGEGRGLQPSTPLPGREGH